MLGLLKPFHILMAAVSTNGQERKNEKLIYVMFQQTALPADYKQATVNAYLSGATDATRLIIESGAGITPTPVVSSNTTEGDKVTLANDLAGLYRVLQLTTEDYKNIRTAFNNKKVDMAVIFGDPDLVVDATGQIITAQVGDRIAIFKGITPNFASNIIDAIDFGVNMNIEKQVAGDADTATVFETILIDA